MAIGAGAHEAERRANPRACHALISETVHSRQKCHGREGLRLAPRFGIIHPGSGGWCIAGLSLSLHRRTAMSLRFKHAVWMLVPVIGLALPALTQAAAEPRYTYVEGGWVHADFDNVNEDGDGWGIGGSYAFHKNFHFVAGLPGRRSRRQRGCQRVQLRPRRQSALAAGARRRRAGALDTRGNRRRELRQRRRWLRPGGGTAH